MITLTGERQAGRFFPLIEGKPASLTKGQLKLLVSMILACGRPGDGFVRATTVAIARLRQALDAAAGPGTGHRLIETGNGPEYRLAIDREKIRSAIAIHPWFFELERPGLFTKTDMQALRKMCRALKA